MRQTLLKLHAKNGTHVILVLKKMRLWVLPKVSWMMFTMFLDKEDSFDSDEVWSNSCDEKQSQKGGSDMLFYLWHRRKTLRNRWLVSSRLWKRRILWDGDERFFKGLQEKWKWVWRIPYLKVVLMAGEGTQSVLRLRQSYSQSWASCSCRFSRTFSIF